MVLLLSALLLISLATKAHCLCAGTVVGDRCIQMSRVKMTHDDAAKEVAEKGGYLVEIPDEDMQSVVYDFVSRSRQVVFIGAQRSDRCSRFQWEESGADLTYLAPGSIIRYSDPAGGCNKFFDYCLAVDLYGRWIATPCNKNTGVYREYFYVANYPKEGPSRTCLGYEYQGRCIEKSNYVLSFEQAVNQTEKENGWLVEPKDQDFNDFLKDKFQNHAYIGARRESTDAPWKWVTDGSEVTATFFERTFPRNENKDHNCMVFDGAKWRNNQCILNYWIGSYPLEERTTTTTPAPTTTTTTADVWTVLDNHYIRVHNLAQTQPGDKTLEECKAMCINDIPGCASVDWIKDKNKCDFNSLNHVNAGCCLIGPPRGNISTHYSLNTFEPVTPNVAQRKEGNWTVLENHFVLVHNLAQTRPGDKTLEECQAMCINDIPGCASVDWIKDKNKCDFNSLNHMTAGCCLIGPGRGNISTHYSLG